MERRLVTWMDVERMVGSLLKRIPTDWDNLLVITRGGMVPACLVSERTGLRNILAAAVVFYEKDERALPAPRFVQFPDDRQVAGRRILVVDDVWDTGSTIVASTPVQLVGHLEAEIGKWRKLVKEGNIKLDAAR